MGEREPLFPENISDETAQALCDFLYRLAADCESRYLAQLLRRERDSRQHDLFDPDHPWKSRPPNR